MSLTSPKFRHVISLDNLTPAERQGIIALGTALANGRPGQGQSALESAVKAWLLSQSSERNLLPREEDADPMAALRKSHSNPDMVAALRKQKPGKKLAGSLYLHPQPQPLAAGGWFLGVHPE